MNEIRIDAIKPVRLIERTGDIRLIACAHGLQFLGPTPQEAWICKEDGRVEWRTIKTQFMSADDYFEAIK